MDRFNDLDIPESLDDALRQNTLALVVYNMQVGILGQIANGDRVLANVLRVLEARAARANGVPAPLLDADRIGGRLSTASGQGLAAQGAR